MFYNVSADIYFATVTHNRNIKKICFAKSLIYRAFFIFTKGARKMYFTNTSFLNSIEAMMKCPPGSRQRGGGRNRCPYRYTKKTATAGSASTTEKRTAALWKFVRHWISGFHKYKTERIISPYITSTASKAKPWAMASTVRLGSPPNPKSGGLTGSCRLRPPHGEHKQRKINCQSCPKALETRVEKLLPLWMIRASTA